MHIHLVLILARTQEILEDFQQKYPQTNDREEAIEIIKAEFESNKRIQSWKWKNLLSLTRLWNGSKSAALKIGEHFAEENPWGKGVIGFLEGITGDTES